MTPLALYITKAGACLTLFAVLFRLLLLRETFFRFTRIVLLTGMLICSLLPLIKLSTYQPNIIHRFTIRLEEAMEVIQPQPTGTTIATPTHELMQATDKLPIATTIGISVNWLAIIATIYLTGVGLMLLRLLIALMRLRQLLKGSTIISDDGYRLVITPEEVVPFSFFRYIVLSEKDYNDNPEAIILHEQMHMRKLHNIDIILSEFVLTLHWFNPMVWMLTRDLREIHEYEADSAVLAQGIAPQQYQLLLVKKAVGEKRFAAVVNNFNHSKIKNRITMMLKTQSTPWARLKALFIVPFVALALFAFSTIDQVLPDNPDDIVKEEAAQQQALDYLRHMQIKHPKGVGYIYVDTSEQIYVMHRTHESYATISSFSMNDDVALLKVFHTAYDHALIHKTPAVTFVIGAEEEVQMKAITYIKEHLRKSYAEWSSSVLSDAETETVKSKMLLSVQFTLLDDVYISTAEKISKNPLYYWEEVRRFSERWQLEPKKVMEKVQFDNNMLHILINAENRLMLQGIESVYHTPENLQISAEYIDKMAMEIANVMEKNRTIPIYFVMQPDPTSSAHLIHHCLTYALPMAYDRAINHQAARLKESPIETKARYPLLLFYTSGNLELPDEWREHLKYYYAWSEYESDKNSNAMIGRADMPVEGEVTYKLINADASGVSLVTLGAGVTYDDLQSVLSHLNGKITDRVLYVFRSGD